MTSLINGQKNSTTKEKLPNLVIAGVVKGGTTSIYSYLSLHPEICCSSVKETCYFSIYRYGQWDSRYRNTTNPHQQYRQYFAHCENQKYILEATPGYFEGGSKLANAIQDCLGNEVKIIIVLRNPIDRFISFYKYKKSMMEIKQTLTIKEYIEQCQQLPLSEKIKQENDTYWGIEGGFYDLYLPEWFDTFNHNVKVAFFDQLKNNPKSLLQDLCQWLEIDPAIYDTAHLTVENKSMGYNNKLLQQIALLINNSLEKFWRSQPKLKTNLRNFYYALNGNFYKENVTDEVLEQLESIYAPHNKRLREQLTDRGYTNLPTWLTENNYIASDK